MSLLTQLFSYNLSMETPLDQGSSPLGKYNKFNSIQFNLSKRSQTNYPSREDGLHAVSPPTPPPTGPPYFLNNHAISQVHQHSTLVLYLLAPFPGHLRRSSYLSLFCKARFSSSYPILYYHFSFRFLLKVYPCYIRPLFGMAAHLLLSLSVRSARQLGAVQQKALSICSVDSARISSLSGRQTLF